MEASNHLVSIVLTSLKHRGSIVYLKKNYWRLLNHLDTSYQTFTGNTFPVTIYSDHLPLQNVFQAPSDKIPLNDPQVYRQVTEIGRFTRDIRYVKGVDNIFADYLSRIKPDRRGTTYSNEDEDEQEVASTESMKFQIHSLKELQGLQEICPEIKKIKTGDKP